VLCFQERKYKLPRWDNQNFRKKGDQLAKRVVTITGGGGFVGQILQNGLNERRYKVLLFDKFRGPLIRILRRKYFGTSNGRVGRALSHRLRRVLGLAERGLTGAGIIRPTGDDILDLRCKLVRRFRGSYAVIHLAALPHPYFKGAIAPDFERINYEGAVNVFEAAREAGVSRFVFASSGQVYGINHPVRIDQFPILETNYCPTLDEGQNLYGFLKLEFEKYLEGACQQQKEIQAISLRLECPGIRSQSPNNFYISTSLENTVAGFAAALDADLSAGCGVFNLADTHVDEAIVNVQEFLRENWSNVPNYTRGNECLLSTEKARAILGYEPQRNGTYFAPGIVF
jgi:nucleoside-diphosphate-sugar epimerase